MTYTVDAVAKALELLFLVAQEPNLGVTELAKRSGNTKARAFRLLGTLEQSGLVRRKEPLATYSLGYKALFIGAAAQEQVSVTQVAKARLPEIGMKLNESVLVRVRDGLESACVAWWDAPHAIRIHSQLGERRPLYAGSSGKLLLAYAPSDIQEEVLRQERPQFTANTPSKRAQLEKEIEKVLKQGYSYSAGERTPDTVSVAAPIRDASGTVIASLAMTSPSSRVPVERLPEYAKALIEAADQFSVELGYMKAV
ncbi:IclR family transcriptional regulator [Herbaspirillum sp. GCM10030257]|uniref:IclR family transcriptional regulator n=1 Tax=Herbaspirillum sp. GCM10030257 TaxID=3273393 RepID=UPI00360C9774